MVFHEDAVALETHLHQALADRKVNRINARREFFYATPSEVRDIFSQVAGAQLVEYRDTADALEWRASGSVTHETQGPASKADLALDALSDATSEAYEPVPTPSETEYESIEHVNGVIDDELDDLGTEDIDSAVMPPVNAPVESPPPATSRPEPVVPQAIPAQWYVDPNDASQWRFWDGHQWTNDFSPRI
jgi:hypothetical protein